MTQSGMAGGKLQNARAEVEGEAQMNLPVENDSGEEVFDVVDRLDQVIGQAPRSRVHEQGLLHRAVHVFVFNSRGQLLLQRRSASKDEYPLRYTSSASGHLETGESYLEAAIRELKEELGLDGGLEYQTTLPAGPATANEHSALYVLHSDTTPVFDPIEILDGQYLDLSTVRQQMEREPDVFTPPFRELLRWFLDHNR